MVALKAMSSIVGLQIVGAAMTFLAVLVMTVALGAEGYGRYAWIVSMGGVGALLLQRGLPTTLVKRFAPLDLKTLETPSPLANTIALYALLAGGTLLAAWALMPALPSLGVARPELALAVPVAAALACLAVADAVLRAAERGVQAQFASQVLRAAGLLAGAALLVFFDIDQPENFLSLYAVTALIAALVFIWPLVMHAARQWRGGGHVHSTPAHFQASLSRGIANHLPVFITGFFVSPEQLAYLAIAIRLTGPGLFGVTASWSYFGAPINRHIKAGDYPKAAQGYRMGRLFSTAVGLAATGAVLGLMWGLTWLPEGPLSSFTDQTLLLGLFGLMSLFRMSVALFGPAQLVAVLLGDDVFIRNINLILLCSLTIGLVLAGLVGLVWVSALIVLAYGIALGGGIGSRVQKLFKQAQS